MQKLPPYLLTKLSDFGLSSDKPHLDTFCETEDYLAPEVLTRSQYTSAIDVLSLGVVGVRFLCSLPSMKLGSTMPQWTSFVVQHAASQKGPHVHTLRRMLSVVPRKRPSANECAESIWSETQAATKYDKQIIEHNGRKRTANKAQQEYLIERNQDSPWISSGM